MSSCASNRRRSRRPSPDSPMPKRRRWSARKRWRKPIRSRLAPRTGRRAAGPPGHRRAATALPRAMAMGAAVPASAVANALASETRPRARPGREPRATPPAHAAQARSSSTATAGSDPPARLIRLAELASPLRLTFAETAHATLRAQPTVLVAPRRTTDIAQNARRGQQIRADLVLYPGDLVFCVGQCKHPLGPSRIVDDQKMLLIRRTATLLDFSSITSALVHTISLFQ